MQRSTRIRERRGTGSPPLVARRREHNPDDIDFLGDLESVLKGSFGLTSDALLELGFKGPTPRKPLTSEQKLRKAAKARLTRALRHTMGKRQKAEIKADGAPSIMIHGGSMTIAPAAGGAGPVIVKDVGSQSGSAAAISPVGLGAAPAASGPDEAVG